MLDSELAQLERTRAEKAARAVLPAAGLVWTATEILHMAGLHAGRDAGIATAFAAAIAWGAAGRGKAPAQLPWWVAIAGGWVAVAETIGPLHSWHHVPVLTIAAVVAGVAASKAAHRHRSVTAAREWREAKADWLGRRHRWRLGGSHLLEFERTLLGELYTISTKGTRKRASQLVGGALEEIIAEAEDLPPSRVRVTRHHLAGRIRVSVRRVDPWAQALLHPLMVEDHKVPLPVPCTIRNPIPVGQDPETGAPLEVTLWDHVGAKIVSITAINGGGKDVLLDCVSERVTAADDAVQIRINVSDKGLAEIESWGPSCLLTAFGEDQKSRAVDVLKVLAGVIAWRARTYKRGRYQPTREDPLLVVIVNESDSAAAVLAIRKGLDVLATKGREYGISYVRAGQRNTRDYGSAKARSQENVRIVGAVSRRGEARHAAGDAAYAMPDMATYGEGHMGVWSVDHLGRGSRNGRTWVFDADEAAHGAEVEAIAQERALDQPGLPAACCEYLGEDLAKLLETEVFTHWAHRRGAPPADSDDGPGPVTAPAPPGDGTGPSAVIVPGAVLTDDEDPLLRWEMDMGNRERDRLDTLAAKLDGVRRMNAETAALPAPPRLSQEIIADAWHRVAAQAEIPEAVRPRMLDMLAAAPSAADPRGGTTIPAVAGAFGVTIWTARTWLENLRDGGAAHVDGRKKAARWRPGPPPAGGGTQTAEGDAP
jgi:hypothetical protein